MNEEIKNYGFQDPVILGSDYFFGGGHGVTSGKPMLQPDRDWRQSLPLFEPQRRKIETSSCTEYNTINPVESLIKRKYGLDKNYSERALSILANNSPSGNDPNVTAETLRKKGLLSEERLPFTDEIKSWEEYMTPNPLSFLMKYESKMWGFKFLHEWVEIDPEKLWNALPFSELGVSVRAWRKKGEFYVKEKGERDTHWTDICFGKYREYWIIDDSYLDDGVRFKKLPWEYPFGYAKVYSIEKKEIFHANWLVDLYNAFVRGRPQLLAFN